MKNCKKAIGVTMILLSVCLIMSIIGFVLLGIFGEKNSIFEGKKMIVICISNYCMLSIAIIIISLIVAIIICVHFYTKNIECENEESSIKKLMLANLITSNIDSQSISYTLNDKTITINKEKKQ